jgi:hypothetical protein
MGELMLIALLVFTLLLIAAGIGLIVAMLARDQPLLGLAGLGLMIVSAIPGTVYGVLTSF